MTSRSQRRVKSIMDKLSSKYEGSMFRYEFDACSRTHIVEVTPLSLYADNKEYGDEEFDYVLDFENRFKETLLFVSTESLTKVSNPIYVAQYEKKINSQSTFESSTNEDISIYSLFGLNISYK